MKQQYVVASVAAVVALMTAGITPLWANGYEFFTVDRVRRVNLVYVGQIREQGTGRLVREPAYFMVTEKRSGMTFPFVNDRPGHYRTPDIGESVEELAGAPVKSTDLVFEVVIDGYKKLTTTSVPRRTKGIVEVNFAVEREAGSAPSAAAQEARATPQQLADGSPVTGDSPGAEEAGEARSRSSRLLFMGIAAVAMIGGAAARSFGPRQRAR